MRPKDVRKMIFKPFTPGTGLLNAEPDEITFDATRAWDMAFTVYISAGDRVITGSEYASNYLALATIRVTLVLKIDIVRFRSVGPD
jgi:hypothetical protein